MLLEIITPDKKLYSGEVKSVKLPGSAGSFGILKNHAPLISSLKKGDVKVIDEQKQNFSFPIKDYSPWGMDNFNLNTVSISQFPIFLSLNYLKMKKSEENY